MESTLTTITNDPNNEYNSQLCEKRPKKFSYCFLFNYARNNADGTPDENWNKAIANKAFRQCFYKNLELSPFYARYNKINPLKCENDFYTMKGLSYTSDGTDYTTLVARELGFGDEAYDGKTMIRMRGANDADCPEEAGHGRALRHRRHLPRPLPLPHPGRLHLRSGQRHRAQAVLHGQLWR